MKKIDNWRKRMNNQNYIKYVLLSGKGSKKTIDTFYYIREIMKDTVEKVLCDDTYQTSALLVRSDFSFSKDASVAVKDHQFGSLERRYDNLLGITEADTFYIREGSSGKLIVMENKDD